MNIDEKLKELKQQYDVVAVIDLDPWHGLQEYEKKIWINRLLTEVHQPSFENNQRIVFTLTLGDVYSSDESTAGALITQLQKQLNLVDISNFFAILLTNDATIPQAYKQNQSFISSDPVPIEIIVYENTHLQKQVQNTHEIKRLSRTEKNTKYNSAVPIKISLDQVNDREKFLLSESQTFCMYPWIHFHAYPTGQAYPCCMADMEYPIGNMRNSTMEQIWNDQPMREIRRNMLEEKTVAACNRCYEQEASGFMSGRISANKHHGHHIGRIAETAADGTLERFELTYWDIRFSNLCNLSCRSCGHIFSSSWYQDQVKLAGPEWKKHNQVLNYAGRFETDAW